MEKKISITLTFNEKEIEELIREITLIQEDKNFEYLNIEYLDELKEDLFWTRQSNN